MALSRYGIKPIVAAITPKEKFRSLDSEFLECHGN